MAAALEEEIEWLSCPLVRSQSEAQTHSRSRDCHRCRSRGQKRRAPPGVARGLPCSLLWVPHSWRGSESEGDVEATEDFNLEDPLELGPEVTCFLQVPVKSSEEENVKVHSPKPPIEELEKWVTWKAQAYETPSWWQELTMVPEVDDYKKLACEVHASFQLPKRVSEQCQVKNDHQAPPALPCLCQKNFLPPPDSIFACQDIQEIQCEKMVAYAWALQFLAEKADLPTGGKPCLLVGSVVELWEERKYYVSFSDEDVFNGIALLEETPIITPEEATSKSALLTLANPPVEKATADMTMEPAEEKRPPNKFPGWEKVLHPSRPIVAARQIPPSSKGQRQMPCSKSLGEGLVQLPQTEELRVDHPVGTPLAYQGVGGCLTSDATTWFCWHNCMFAEGSTIRRGPWLRLIENGSTIRACHSNHECQLHCKRQGDRGNLHGHHNHLSGVGDPQWPQTGGLGPGSYNTGCHRPHLRSNQITTFVQRDELTTAFKQGSELITAFGWIGLLMTASGQKE